MSYWSPRYFGANHWASNYWGGVVVPVPTVSVGGGGGYYAGLRRWQRLIEPLRERLRDRSQERADALRRQALREDEEILEMLG